MQVILLVSDIVLIVTCAVLLGLSSALSPDLVVPALLLHRLLRARQTP